MSTIHYSLYSCGESYVTPFLPSLPDLSLAGCSPYIDGEMMVVSESGQLYIRRKSSEVISLPSFDQDFKLCCYGSQPRSLLLATPTNLFHLDIRVSLSDV